AAIDSIAGRKLSQSAEEGWNARAQQVIDTISATGDNTVYTLTEDEAAAFAALSLPVTDKVISDLGAQNVLDAMQGK
ncbi:MAG: C4-dicarboxylate ABC transporter substrate-binding protein, partial [Maritimibacter sp.]